MTKIEGRKDDNLLLDKGGRGFPYIVFMDDDGTIITVQDDRTVAGFDKTFKEKVQRFLELRAKAQSGDPGAQIDFALLEGDLGRIKFDEVQKRLEGKKLSDAQKQVLGEVELGAMIAAAADATDEGAFRDAAKRLADGFAAGRVPATNERKQPFFNILLQYGLSEKNPDLAQKSLDALKPILRETLGDNNERLEAAIRKMDDKIAELREPKKEGGGGDEGIEEGCGEEPEGGK